MQRIIPQTVAPSPASTRFTFASFGGQLSGILAVQDGALYFFTEACDQALNVTDCPSVLGTGRINADRDAYYQAQLDARLPASNEEV